MQLQVKLRREKKQIYKVYSLKKNKKKKKKKTYLSVKELRREEKRTKNKYWCIFIYI